MTNSTQHPNAQDACALQPDPRNIITQDAFQVSERLLNRPLASPTRRALAQCIDLLVVVMLVELPESLLFSLVIGLAWVRFTKRKLRSKMTSLLVVTLSVWLVLMALSGFEDYDQHSSFQQIEAPEIKEAQWDAELETLEPIQKESSLKGIWREFSFIGLAKGLMSDLGLGLGWASFYYTVLHAWFHGQTLGKRVMGIRVVQLSDEPLSLWDGFGRYGGYSAGIATGLTGFLQVFWDPNRQGIHDKIASTVVVDLRSQARKQARQTRRSLEISDDNNKEIKHDPSIGR
ncbi:RDD family protein [Ferrimonas aestuarii]|uniref:RDD family protein n=1 Tax=Ferrimonas aestuarii TaxID=2569539 RepID=A0A4U1BR63_9GAMM|nr:RDD family protein [Ferrimonas aestuarii]